MPWRGIDEHVEALASHAQEELAAAGHHRLPPVDIIIAALAARHGLGVLHYDKDYDIIVAKTGLRYESLWLTQAGYF